MRSTIEIQRAKNAIITALRQPGLNPIQQSIFAGMLQGLNYAADLPHCEAIQRLLAGDPIEPGKDPSMGLETLNKLPGIAGRE